MLLDNNTARCELSLFTPKAGRYVFSVEEEQDNATLYLTHNNKPIWNLSMSPYVFDLTKGTTEGYGLQMYVHAAPEVATGVENTESAQKQYKKIVIDQKIYIVTPEGAIYDATGKKVQ